MEYNRSDIFYEINNERIAQDAEWGGIKHDDTHNSWDWIAYLTKHLGKAVMWPFNRDKFRYQMIRVAALAVAAVEWIERTAPAPAQDTPAQQGLGGSGTADTTPRDTATKGGSNGKA